MENLKEKYFRVSLEIIRLISQMNDLLFIASSSKEYLELHKKYDQLNIQRRELYRQIKTEEYLSCNHIWVTTLNGYDRHKERSHKYCGCIKCGLDQSVLYLMECGNDFNGLNLDQKIMYEFMEEHDYLREIHSKVFCNLDLAKAIYSKIRTAHSDIDDETARKYFEIALDNMRNIQVSDARKTSRARRLNISAEKL